MCILVVYKLHSYNYIHITTSYYYYVATTSNLICLLLQITYADLRELPTESNRNAADQEPVITYSQIA